MHDYESGLDRAADEPWSQTPEDGARPFERFARSILDGLSAHVAVLDASGTIVATNEAWKAFAVANGADPGRVSEGPTTWGRAPRRRGRTPMVPRSSRSG